MGLWVLSLNIETFELRKILKPNFNQKKGHLQKLVGTRFHICTYFGQVARLNQKNKYTHAFSAVTSKFKKVKTGNLVDRFPMKGTITAQSTSFRLQKEGLSSQISQKIFKSKTQNFCHIKCEF